MKETNYEYECYRHLHYTKLRTEANSQTEHLLAVGKQRSKNLVRTICSAVDRQTDTQDQEKTSSVSRNLPSPHPQYHVTLSSLSEEIKIQGPYLRTGS